MPKRSNDFQKLIKTIYKQIVPEGGSVEESGMIYDKDSGGLREVDILVKYRYAGHDFCFIVECRDRSRNETVEWIDALIGKSKSLNVDKVIAVSSKGFALSARKKAKENGIVTLTLDVAEEADWTKFAIRPGVMVFTDDSYELTDVFYKQGDEYLPITYLGLENLVEMNGKIVGNLQGLVGAFFKKILIPQIDEYKKNHLMELFKTREDLDKSLIVEKEYIWQGICLVTSDGTRIELAELKFVVSGNRKVTDVKQDHYLYNQKMVSTGKYKDIDQSTLIFYTVQDPETKKLHFKWEREINEE